MLEGFGINIYLFSEESGIFGVTSCLWLSLQLDFHLSIECFSSVILILSLSKWCWKLPNFVASWQFPKAPTMPSPAPHRTVCTHPQLSGKINFTLWSKLPMSSMIKDIDDLETSQLLRKVNGAGAVVQILARISYEMILCLSVNQCPICSSYDTGCLILDFNLV